MGPAARQVRALLWKDWLCRRRQPVLSLAEFLWPCILFVILIVLRFQEPPRHRDNCYLQPRDLPSQGVFPFVQGLLCNTGSRCRNTSYAGSTEHHFRLDVDMVDSADVVDLEKEAVSSSPTIKDEREPFPKHVLLCILPRFQTTAGRHKKISDLVFLQEMQDLAEEIYEMMNKATNLQKLWLERSKTPDAGYGAGFFTAGLSETEEAISRLEALRQQPRIWDLLLSLPGLGGGLRGAARLLQALSDSLTSLEDSDWLPLGPAVCRVSEAVLNVTISVLTFLQEHGVAGTGPGCRPTPLHSILWDPQQVRADLKSRFGLEDFRAQRVLNYSAELTEVPTPRSLERMLCSVLSQTSEDEGDRGHPGDCHPRWSAAKDYLVHAVSWLHVYEQVSCQWREGSRLQELLAGAGRSLRALGSRLEEQSLPWKVLEALHAGLFLLSDSLAADGPTGRPTSPETLFHTPEKAQLSLEQTRYWKVLTGFIRKTCAVARYANAPDGFPNGLPAFSEESPCYEENMDWKVISENYFAFLKNFLKSPVASISRLLNSTKELLMMEKKWHTLKDEPADLLVSFVEFLQKLLLPESFHSPSVPQSRNPRSLTETSVHTGPLWISHLKSLEGEPSGSATQKLLKLGKEMIEKIQTLERKESKYILRFMELLLFEINPKLLELWMGDIPKGERSKVETSSILLNFSVPENERILSKSFNFSQLFHSDWPESPAAEMDFVYFSETIINSLYELGFLRRDQVSEALGAVHAVRNVSHHLLTLSGPQKQEAGKALTHVYLSVFRDEGAPLLLQIASSFHQHIDKCLSIRSTEALLSVLTQISKRILDLIKEFNFQSISKAFTFLYETTEVLGGISEVSYCQQLLSAFNFLELRTQSLMSAEGPELEVIHATLTGLRQLFIVDGELRVSLFQYMNHLFNGSAEALLGNECFAVNNQSISSVNYSINGGSPFSLPWTQILSNLSANGIAFSEFTAVHCTVSWLQMWTEILGSIAQIWKVDVNVFSPVHAGLTELLDELESDVIIPKTCQGIFPTHGPARLILRLFENVTQADGFQGWDDLLTLRDLWVALGDAFVRVKSLNLDQLEKSLFSMEASLSQLKAFPFNTSASREGSYSLLDVFSELSNSSEYVTRYVHLINHFLSNNPTNYGVTFESIIINLRETMLFLRNVSLDQDLLSCADIFQNVTDFILEEGLLYINTSQRTLHTLAILNSTFSSEATISRLKGCVEWMDIVNHLHVTGHPSSSQGRLQGALRSFRDVGNTMNSTLKLVTWLLDMMEPGCSLKKSNINCVNIYLKNVTDFLNVIFTAVFEKEKVPKFEILLSLLNDSTDQIRMIIYNLTRDFEFASQSNWKHFTEAILRSIEIPNEIPSQFQNLWLHLVALGKEMKKLTKDVFPNILENNSSSEVEKLFNVFATSPKEKDINSLGNSFLHLASYLAFNLSDDLQNSAQISSHEVMQAVGLGIQLIRDVFSSLLPSVHHSSLEGPGHSQALQKVTSLLRALRETDIDLLVDQLEQAGEGLVGFFKNVSRVGTDHLGVHMLVGLVEQVVDSSRSWDITRLLRLSHLFPRADVNAMVDASYALPHIVSLLHRIVDRNITEALKVVCDFTLLHGMSISGVTSEDFTAMIKTLLDTIELIADKPGVLTEALTCLPVVWCRNHTTSGFQQDPKLEACDGRELTSSFYSKVASMLDNLHLSPPGDVSQCSNESSQMEITRKMVCVIHELGDWNSILLELSEVFHVKSLLVKTMQEFWQKVLPFVPSSGNQSNGSMSALCSTGPIKQIALQIIEKLKSVNFTNVTSDENILHKLASLNKILNLDKGTEAFGGNISLNLERMIKLLSGDQNLDNNAHSLVSPFMTFLNATLAGSNVEALSSFIKTSEATYNFDKLWLEFQQTVKDLNHDLNIRHLFSEINKDIQMINSVALQNITLQLAHFLESLNSSSLQALEITEDFLSVTKNWLHKHTNEEYSRMTQTLFLLMANKSLADLALLTKDITTYMGYLKNISREGNFDDALFTQLVNQEQLTNFSVVQLLLGSFLINSVSNLAGSSQEASWNLSDTDLQIMNFMDLPMSQTQSENGERITVPPGSRVEFMDRLLKTFFSFLRKGNSENRLSLLRKDFSKDVTVEMGSIAKDKILEILQVDQILTSMTEDKLMSIFSSLKETMYHLIKSSFLLDNGEFSFDSHRGLQFMRGLFNVLLRETSMKNRTGNNLELLALARQLLFRRNSSEDLSRLSHDLQAALHLVRETSGAIANLRATLLNSFNKDFCSLCPTLQQVILANLTDLLFFVNTSFPLRSRATLQITKRLLGIVSRADGEGQVPEPLVEMSATLTMLVSDCAKMEGLATSVDSIVKLLELAKKVSGKVDTLFETYVIPGTNDTMTFFDTLYSILQHSVQNVNEIRTLKKVDRSVYENINDLVTPFLDLAFGMIGVKPNISEDSDIFNVPSNIVSRVNESKDFSYILKEIAEFLTSGKINLADVEHFLVAIHNGTQIFSVDSVNIWEEILDCLVPINDLTSQIDFLHPNPVSSPSFRQGAHEIIPSSGETLSQNSTEPEIALRTVTGLLGEALWSNLENERAVFNLWLTLAQHPNTLLKAVETVAEVSRGLKGGSARELGTALVVTPSLSRNAAPEQPEEAVPSVSPRTALLKAELLNSSRWASSTRALFQPILEGFSNATAGKNVTSGKGEKTERDVMGPPYILKPLSRFENYLKGLIAFIEYWQEVPLTRQSVAEMCRGSGQPGKPAAAVATLQRVKMLALHAVLILTENPSLTQDVLCAALSCPHGGARRLLVSGLRGVAALQDHYQEMKAMWASPRPQDCERLGGKLAGAVERLRSRVDTAGAWGCACPPALDADPRRLHTLVQNLAKTFFSGNPIMTFLSNFTVTADVKVKDLMSNVTELTEELRSSIPLSEDTIHSMLEASIAHSQVLSSALTVALSGRCDQDVVGLLLALPEGAAARLAVRELCDLSGAAVYALVMRMSRNLDLRSFVYKTLIPAEASGVLNSLLDVVSGLSRLLPKAGHVLEHLPEFLHALKIPALLDSPSSHQAPRRGQARSAALGSFQSVMKMLCKEQEAFLSNSLAFISLPGVHELLGDDREKFNIPKDSPPFCLKLYQEILQSPNGALVWSFLKPILHGKILYTPNTPEINRVIQKANYTFFFVDKLKTLSETLLKVSSIVQGTGNGQGLRRLQKVLRNKFIRNFVESQLHISVDKLTEQLQTYRGVLGRMLSHRGAGRLHFLGRAVANLSSCVLLDRFQGLGSAAALEAKSQELTRQNSFLAGVIFNSSLAGENFGSESLPLPPHLTYTLRTSVLYSMRTDLVKNPFWKFHPQSLPNDGFKYNYVFAPLQDMIERAIILEQTGQDAVGPAVQAQATPYPCHRSDLFLNNVGFFFPLIMMLTWMVSVASMVRKLVHEREVQIEEYLTMMGVHPAAHFLAWFLENVAVVTLSSAALAVALRASGIFAYSNTLVVFLFLLDFGVSIVMLSYFLSAFFRQANTAALCTSLAYMISFLPYIVLLVLHNQLSVATQIFLCLLSTTAFGQGVFFITFLEGQEAGVQWGNMYESSEQVGMAFAWVCWMMLFDSGLYFLCGWYLSNLIPGAFGLRKPWYFPVTASYWRDVCGSVAKWWCALGARPVFREDLASKGTSPQNVKGALEGGPSGVTLVSVTKEYQPRKAAVQDLTLTFHSGQITALLGTNGAGKTTVISMLTGLYPPTSGTILVNGKDLQTDLAAVRRELGVCPQQDVLFDTLTVREHLLLFASIKAPQWTRAELQRHVHRTLWDVGLTSHQHKQARALSGGLRRKLSIGVAFLGTSRTVVLDEPTSGVDPCSRRGIWDILLRHREGRTLIFTTHHLDEAEALSDRVAVLQHGRLRCWAPPSCLTDAHSQGLSLTLARQPSALEADDVKATAGATSLIQTYVPRALLKASSGRELRYAVPKDADPACFQGLFQALEQNLCRLHLTGYGVSDTTLEEVFLMLLQDSPTQSDLAPGPELELQSHRPPERSPCHYGAAARTPPARGGPRILAQVTALLSKRLRHTRRAWRGALSNLLLPVLFVALAMGLFMVRPLAVDYPPLKLTPGHYERAEAYFFSSESDDMGLAHVLLRKFEDQDLLCANPNPDLDNSSCWNTDPFSHPKAQGSCACLPCPNGSAGAPYLTNGLGHTLLNLSAFPLEEYLLLPSEKPRLGGWSFGVRIPGPVQDANSNISKPQTLAKVWYNQKAFHSLPSYLNHLNNLILWRLLPSAVDWRQYGITLYSHPYRGALLNEDKILESIRQCGVALCIVLGFSILSASIASSVVRDRVTGAKRLQHVSGLGYRTYWLANFLYDMLFYLVAVGLCVAVIVAFQLTAFTFRENLAATALLLALFGYATLPWMYLLSSVFSSSDVAFISYVSLNFIFGLCTMLMTTMPRLLAIVSRAQNLQDIYDTLRWAFTPLPPFCLAQGLVELCYHQLQYDLTHSLGIDPYVSPFELGFLGWIFVQLALQGSALLLLRLLLHWDLAARCRGRSAIQGTVTSCKDTDVEKEQMRVLKGRTSDDILVLYNLSKSYRGFFKRTAAVQDISVGIRRGECFGLLGVNGAGKSTTFKMLSGDVRPSSGHAVIRTPTGEDVAVSPAGLAGLRVGYCPQQDALDPFLTGWEHLRYYCSLRGIPEPHIPQVAGDLVRRLHLEAHVDQPVATYSGGTKRKLSAALALLGKPDLLLLDEPSSGMDPCSKRFLWEAITKEVQEGCAVVLTSHSMEECEALCTRLAIMVDGSFRCLGSPQHIKNRFGDGYTVRVWLCREDSQHSAVSDCLRLHVPDVQFKGQRLNLLEYHVPKRWECLAELFRVLEDNKTLLNIKHYSINQTTLEQVFMELAAERTPAPAPPPGGEQPHHLPV